jgi:AcrR family transcriptional regulator
MSRAARSASRKGRAAAPARELSHARIRTVALELIDRAGLEAFSTRKLGEALGCEAMALYWYYPSKDALLDAVVEQLMTNVGFALPRGDEPWVLALRRVAHAYRRIAQDHPRAFPLLATRRFASEGTYAFLEELFAFARRQGVPDRTAARFYRLVSSYCNGFALNELAQRREAPGPDPDRFPHVAAVSAYLAPAHLDDLFEFGLDTLLGALLGAPDLGPRTSARGQIEHEHEHEQEHEHDARGAGARARKRSRLT